MTDAALLVVNVMCQLAVVVCAAWVTTRIGGLRAAPARRALWLTVMLSPLLLVALAVAPARVVVVSVGPDDSGRGRRALIHTPAVTPAVRVAAGDHETTATLGHAGNVARPVRPSSAEMPPPSAQAASRDRVGSVGRLGRGLAWAAFITYAAGALVWAARTVVGFVRVRRLVADGTPADDPGIAAAVTEVAVSLDMASPVPLLASRATATPFCAGVRRPAIVVPHALLADLDRLKMVVAHELAHIRNLDHVWTAAGSLVRVLLYCHPGFYIAWRGYRLASEEVCDAAAVAVTGSRRAYVECLADMARVSLGAQPLGFAEPRGSLRGRAHRVLHGTGGVSMLRKRAVLLGGALVGTTILALSSVRLVVATPGEAASGGATDEVTRDADRWATRIENLDAIHKALMQFNEERGGYPLWLSELHPRYLPDASQLLDPFDLARGAPDESRNSAETDPTLPVSYVYKLTPRRRDSRLAGLASHGSHAPLVSTGFQRGFGELNLSVTGRLYLSGWGWRTLREALHAVETPRDTGGLIFAMELRDAPDGFVPPPRLKSDLDAIVAEFRSQMGDTAGRHHAEGILRAWGHDRDGAERAMREALRRAPEDTQTVFHYARLLHHMGRHADAIPHYEQVVASGRRDMRQWEEAHRHLSALYGEAGAGAKHSALIDGFAAYLMDTGSDLDGDLLRMYADAGLHERVVTAGPEILKRHANNRDIAGLLEASHRTLGNAAEESRYHRMANPVYGLVGKEAPDFGMKRADGSTLSLGDVAGSPVLLTLWWGRRDPTHTTRVAAIEVLHQRYASRGLVVLGGFAESDAEGRALERQAVDGLATFPVLSHGSTAFRAYQVQGTATILIGRQGYVRHVTTDAHDPAAGVEAAVRDALAPRQATAERFRIAGVTRDDAGDRVAGAALTLYVTHPPNREWRPAAEATSGPGGAFDFGLHAASRPAGPNEGPWYQVVARAEGRPLGLAFLGRGERRHDQVQVRFAQAAPLRGRVVDEAGDGIAGALVQVRSVVEPSTQPNTPGKLALLHRLPGGALSATTDNDGTFTIEAMPSGVGGMVVVRAAGYADGDRGYKASADQPLRVVLPRPGVLTGRVLYGDVGGMEAPARGVEVRVRTAEPAAFGGRGYGDGGGRRPYPHQFSARVSTDADGRYRLEGIPPGYLNIWARAEGYTCTAWDTHPIVGEQTHTADLYLIKGGFIAGRVLDDATGKPIRPQAASAIGVQGPSSPRSGHGVASTWLDDDGRYRIRVAPGINYAYIQGIPGWTPVGDSRPEDNAVHVEKGETVEVNFRVVREKPDAGG